MTIQVLITGDNHLDPPARAFGPRLYERKKDFLRCFEAAVGYALENRPDIFLICGDLFDNIKPRNPPRAKLMTHFKKLYDVGVKTFAIGGHHDTPKSVEEGSSPLALYQNAGYLVFFEDFKPVAYDLVTAGGKARLWGMSYDPTLLPGADPLAVHPLKPHPEQGGVNILMLHYPIEGFKGVYPRESMVKRVSIPRNLHLVAAGHLHAHQKSVVGETTIIYPGSTERRSFLEEEEVKGFVWLEVGEEGVVYEELIPTPARKMKTVELQVGNHENLTQHIKKMLEELKDPELLILVKLCGRVSVEQLSTYRRSELISFSSDKFFSVSFDEKLLDVVAPERVEPLPRTTPLEEVRRYFIRLMDSKREEKEIINEALQLCIQNLREAGAW